MFSSEIPELRDMSLVQISMALMMFWKCEKNYKLSEDFRKAGDGFPRMIKIKKMMY